METLHLTTSTKLAADLCQIEEFYKQHNVLESTMLWNSCGERELEEHTEHTPSLTFRMTTVTQESD